MSFWSVVQTESRREQTAADFLEQKEFKTYCPKILTERDRVAPLFPSYLFVEIIDHWWSVRWTVGVVRVLMMDDRPAIVSPTMLDEIRNAEIDGLVQLPEQAPLSKPRALQCGDSIRVTRGSFANRIGIFQGQSGPQRSRILLNLLGREVRALVATADLVRRES